jgi:type IV pilus assembly protein PilW
MRQTSIRAQQLSQVQNQQRMAMYFLHNAIVNAGYQTGVDASTPPQPADPAVVFPARTTGTAPLFPAAGQTLVGTGNGSGSDSISVRFVASSTVAQQGCTAALTAGNRYINTFSVSGGFLQCVELNETTGVSTTNNLISGLVSMTIWYGVDSNGNGSVTNYFTATASAGTSVTSGGFWPVAIFDNPANGFYGVQGVKTARVTLVFTNPLATDPGQPATVSLTETIPYMANI